MTDIDRDRLLSFRQDGAHQVMERLNLDVLVATTFDNVRYITDRRPFYVTGWMPNAIAVLPRQGEPVVLHPDEFVAPSPWWANDGSALQESFGWNHFTIFNPALVSEIYADWLDWAFAQIGVTRGRVGLDSAPWQWYATFTEKFPQLELVDVEEALLRQRAVKCPEEITLLRDAAVVSSTAVMKGLAAATEGAQELDIYGAAMGASYGEGSEGDAFYPFMTCGPVQGGALYPVGRELRPGDPVILDLGPILDGYMGDCMRTEYVGEPTAAFQDLYRTVYDCMYAGIKATKPGVKTSQVDAAVRAVQRERGFDVTRFDSGHGIGLNCCELPIIMRAEAYSKRRDLDLTLEPGMVFTLEPRLYKNIDEQQIIQASLEEIILVTEGGCEVLTDAPFLEDLVDIQARAYAD